MSANKFFSHKKNKVLRFYQLFFVNKIITESKMNDDADLEYENIRDTSFNDFYLVEEVQGILQQVKTALRHVFVYYSSFGDRKNMSYLKCQKYIKMLSDALIIPKYISANEADLLYFKITCNSQNLDLKKFHQLLVEIADHIYQSQTQQNAIYLLFTNHFKRLYSNILYSSDFGKIIQKLNDPIEQFFLVVMPPLMPMLAKIYNFNQVSFQVFLTQFELNSLLINNSQASLIYYEIQHRPASPVVQLLCKSFTLMMKFDISFEHFIEALIRIALIYSSSGNENDQLKAFKLLIQKIEESMGYQFFQKHHSQTQNMKIQLTSIVTASILKYQMGSIKPRSLSIQNDPIKFANWSQGTFDQYGVQLGQLFQIYSQKGENSFKSYLKAHKFRKMLTDAEIIGSYINTAEFDQLCEKVQDGRFTFNSFIKSLEIFATVTGQYNKELELQVIVNKKLLPLLKRESQQNLIFKELGEILQDEEILDMLPMLEKQLSIYFNHYSDNQHKIELEPFQKFLVSFEIQSALIGQIQLMNIFYALASLNNNSKQIPYLDFQQFIESICLIGVRIFPRQDRKMSVKNIISIARLFISSKDLLRAKAQSRLRRIKATQSKRSQLYFKFDEQQFLFEQQEEINLEKFGQL